MVNVSANGFAFATHSTEIGNAKGTLVYLKVKDFDVMNGKDLAGHIIRISDNDGEYIVGCRMLDDNMDIYNFVEENYRGR